MCQLPQLRIGRLILLIVTVASGSYAAVPDSLIPKGGFRSAPADPEAGAKLGKYLMIGGAAGIVVGGVISLTEPFVAGVNQARCDANGSGTSCEDASRESSGIGKGLLITGLVALPVGILIAAMSRDDSGRNHDYYGSIGPRRIEAGFRRGF